MPNPLCKATEKIVTPEANIFAHLQQTLQPQSWASSVSCTLMP